jgi:tetratricopeptide (TPR) repeat protein
MKTDFSATLAESACASSRPVAWLKTRRTILAPLEFQGRARSPLRAANRNENTLVPRRRARSDAPCPASVQGRKARNYVLLCLTTAIIWIFTGSAMAADFSNAFSAANKLYAEGKFAEAAAGYEKILQARQVSPALYFNQGNAEFKSGNWGRAIAAYRRAARLAPRDAEVRANLEFARDQVTGPTQRESRWSNWLGTLTLNEWTALTAIAFWLTVALLAAGQIKPALKPALRNLTLGAAMATLLAGAGLGADTALHFSRQTAVVIAPDVTARSGPFDEAQSAFTAHNGAELVVLNRREGWLQVTDGSGRIGWLPQPQVEILPGS